MDPSPPPAPRRASIEAPTREPSVVRQLAGEAANAARSASEPIVEDIVSSISMLVLIVLMVPIGIVGLVVSFLLLGLVYTTIGVPSGALGSVFSIAWFVGTLLGLGFVFRKLYRRTPRRLRAAYAAPMEANDDLAAASANWAFGADDLDSTPAEAPSAAAPTLAELDARLAPKTATEPPPG